MGALSEQGKVVVKFLVDGSDSLEEGEFPNTYQKIEAFSLTHDELTLRLVLESMKHLGQTEEESVAYVRNILSVPWSEVFRQMDQLINRVQPFADLLDNLGPYAKTYEPPWKESLEVVAKEQATSLGKILESFEQGNPALLSDELCIRFLPIFKRTRKLFNEEVVPFLQKKVGKTEQWSDKSMLPVNENILRSRFPVVYQRIKAVGDRTPDSFYYEDLVEGSRLMIQRGENSFPAYGSHKPAQLIERWFNGLTMARESLYAISGFGDGSHIRYFMKESSSGTNFLAAEKDPALLRETFARFDCSDILSHERFMLGVGEPNDDYFRDIQTAALTGVSDVNSILFSPLHSVDEAYYDRMRNELVRQYLVIRPLMEVNVRTATDIQENTFKNLPYLANSPDIGDLKGGLEDVPFVLVGAGSSLDESIDFLKEVQDKAIIVASNSPYRKLINNGIRPHLVVTADPLCSNNGRI